MTKSSPVSAIDLFCGAGGLACGLQQAGVKVVAGIDVDPDCQFPFSTNNSAEFHLRDIRTVTGNELKEMWGPDDSLKLLAGCAPCQPFSKLRQSGKNSKDDKWNLLREFGRLVDEAEPQIVTMENVPGLARTDIFVDFLAKLISNGYLVDHRIVFLPDYGLPQHRKRLVLIASRAGTINVPTGTHDSNQYATVKDTIGSIEPLIHGEQSLTDPMHRAQSLSERNMLRIRCSTPGGTWREWPVELQLACHKKESGKYYSSVYGRMDWNSPSPTITTQFYNYGTGRFGHPEQDRAISLREGSMLQGFPLNYRFYPDGERVAIDKIGRLIGNAVPPVLGKVIGQAIMAA
ncbi:DNA cytosine methyltransferase [Rhodococcus sp. NPDC060086]|uniref:DNA cytosine methyltransferase n=1 Tax=Rhodococcus sp. NPDC060086 TaxID=3347055 RepID=UPI00365ED716